MALRLVSAGLTNMGLKRDGNEDVFAVVEGLDLYLVADGMGGHEKGEVASAMTSETVIGYVRDFDGEDRVQVLKDAVSMANASVYHMATTVKGHAGMGTTFVGLIRSGGDVLGVVHVGDSRCYRLRGGGLERLTRDHSLVEEYGEGDPEICALIAKSAYGSVITRSVGADSKVELTVRSETARVGDVYLLCSDGLNGMVPDEGIEQTLLNNHDPKDAVQALIQAALDAGGDDNVTVVIVAVESGEEPAIIELSVSDDTGSAAVE